MFQGLGVEGFRAKGIVPKMEPSFLKWPSEL